MSRWLISVPVWGERCVEVFCACGLPALLAAIDVLNNIEVEPDAEGNFPFVDVRLVVHTDCPDRVRAAAAPHQVDCRSLPAGLRDFDCMSQAHREVLNMACVGDVVVPLTADTVLSRGGLLYCAEQLDNPQKLLVVCPAPRALQEGKLPDSTDGASLMRWAWEHRHPLTEAATWPDGDLADLSRTHYVSEDGQSVCTRVCLPHPIAVRIDGRPLPFVPTIDVNFVDNFHRTEICVPPDSEQLALVELSPRDKDSARSPRSMSERLAAYELRIPAPHQRWFLTHRIMLVGPQQDCGDGEVVDRIMQASGGWP